MAGCIERIHRPPPEEEETEDREGEVSEGHVTCYLGDAGSEHILGDAGGLRIEELPRAATEHRHERHHEDDDAEAADPLGEAAPEVK